MDSLTDVFTMNVTDVPREDLLNLCGIQCDVNKYVQSTCLELFIMEASF